MSRLEICLSCDLRDSEINCCSVCHCFIPALVSRKDGVCPEGKW